MSRTTINRRQLFFPLLTVLLALIAMAGVHAGKKPFASQSLASSLEPEGRHIIPCAPEVILPQIHAEDTARVTPPTLVECHCDTHGQPRIPFSLALILLAGSPMGLLLGSPIKSTTTIRSARRRRTSSKRLMPQPVPSPTVQQFPHRHRRYAGTTVRRFIAPKKTQQKEKVPLEWLKKLCGSDSGREFVRDMANGYSVYLTDQSVIGGFGVTPTVNGTPTNDIFIARTISPQVLSYFNRFYGFTGDQSNFQIATLAHERGHTINHGSGRPITGNGDEAFARFYGDLVADSLGLSPLYPNFGFNYADYVGVVNWDVSHGNSGKSSTATEYRGPTISSNALDRIKGQSSLLEGWDCDRLKAEGGQ